MKSLPAIETLLPHRAPMLWLDEVIARDGDCVRCALTPRPDHIFVEAGRVEPLIAIEWMAQTVGALVGMRDREQSLDPRPGYLIAIPDARFHVSHFALGERLEIEAKRVWGDDQLASFECRVTRGELVCATSQVSVYRKALTRSEPP